MKVHLIALPVLASSLMLMPAKGMNAETFTSTTQKLSDSVNDSELRHIAQSITVRILADGTSVGSGTLIKQEGNLYTVLTNAHVLLQGVSFRVQTADGKEHHAKALAERSLKGTDLALLQFQADRQYQVAALERSGKISVNAPVLASGFSFDQKDLTFIHGAVSLLPDRALKEGYQIGYSGELHQGMSGGPLLNQAGRVVGVNGITAYPILNTAYIFADGSVPSKAQITQMRQASWAVPILPSIED